MSMSIETLLRKVPELVPSAQQMAEEQDDEPCLGELLEALAGLVLNELAPGPDEEARLLRLDEPDESDTLGRWFEAVEALAAGDDDEEARFLVGSAFLGSLGPLSRVLAARWLGPATRTILADLEEGWPEEDHLAWDEDEEPGWADDQEETSRLGDRRAEPSGRPEPQGGLSPEEA
jgi:hypothetical protein